MIIHDERSIVRIIRERQAAMRREIDRRGIALKAISQDSGIEYRTLLTYFPADGDREPAQIPGSAIFALAGAIPNDILSLLLPAGHLVVRVPEEIDHDELSDLAADYVKSKQDAHKVDSPAGRDIADCEREELDSKVVQFARAAAA